MSPSSEHGTADEHGDATEPLRPSDHIDSSTTGQGSQQPRLGLVGWLRFAWRQLTSMRTAIVLLLMLALAAVPGSLVPQSSSDPNGVIAVRAENPDLVWLYDALQLHDVYSSPWFTAITILLLTSLVGCVIPRLMHHWKAMFAAPPKTPARLSRLVGFQTVAGDADDIDRADALLRRAGYRTRRYGDSVSAERGYLRETGNLVFHISIVVIVLAVAIGSGFGFTAQRLVVTGDAYANSPSSYDTYSPGRWFEDDDLPAFTTRLDDLDVVYEMENLDALGMPIDFTAAVTVTTQDGETVGQIKVNEPLRVDDVDMYLLQNGYAPEITVTSPDGEVVFEGAVPFLPQDDSTMLSLGVVRIADGLDEQLGMQGFLYPTAYELDTGAFTSTYPDLLAPVLSLQAFEGDLGVDGGQPQSVYAPLDVEDMEPIAGGDADEPAVTLEPGESMTMSNGATVTFDGVLRYAVIDIHKDVTQPWVLGGAIALVAGLLTSLLVPRRRLWVKAADGRLEVAGLARGEDPRLEAAVTAFATSLRGGADADDEDARSADAEQETSAEPEPQDAEPDAEHESEPDSEHDAEHDAEPDAEHDAEPDAEHDAEHDPGSTSDDPPADEQRA